MRIVLELLVDLFLRNPVALYKVIFKHSPRWEAFVANLDCLVREFSAVPKIVSRLTK